MSSRVIGQSRPAITASHLRTDPWWALPITVVIVVGSFIVYSTWAAERAPPAPPICRVLSTVFYRSCLHPSFGFGLPDIHLPIIGCSPAFPSLPGRVVPVDQPILPQGVLPLVLADACLRGPAIEARP
jgi:hypothetical protein